MAFFFEKLTNSSPCFTCSGDVMGLLTKINAFSNYCLSMHATYAPNQHKPPRYFSTIRHKNLLQFRLKSVLGKNSKLFLRRNSFNNVSRKSSYCGWTTIQEYKKARPAEKAGRVHPELARSLLHPLLGRDVQWLPERAAPERRQSRK